MILTKSQTFHQVDQMMNQTIIIHLQIILEEEFEEKGVKEVELQDLEEEQRVRLNLIFENNVFIMINFFFHCFKVNVNNN